MKVRLNLFRALIILVSLSLRALSAPQPNPTPRILVETAIERMGGHEAFDVVQRLSIEETGLQYHLMDAEHPSPPFYPDYFHAQEQIDFQLPAVRRKFTDGADALYGNHADAVYTPAGVTAVNQRAGKTVSRRTPTPRHWLLQNPVAVLRAALVADDLKAARDATIWGINQHSVVFHHEGTSVRLFFNLLNGYLTASEIITTEPWEVVWDIADVRLKTLYTGWEIQPGGFHFPEQWDVFFDDLPFMTRTISRVSVNPSFPSDTFQPLADETTPLRGKVDDLAPGPPDRPMVELAPGVLQVTPGPMPGNFTTIIVHQSDGIVIIEAPCSSGWSSKIIEEAQRRFPGIPIKAVVTADDIWWHFAGIREYVARGIPIYLLDQNAAILRALIAAPRTPESGQPATAPPETQPDSSEQPCDHRQRSEPRCSLSDSRQHRSIHDDVFSRTPDVVHSGHGPALRSGWKFRL